MVGPVLMCIEVCGMTIRTVVRTRCQVGIRRRADQRGPADPVLVTKTAAIAMDSADDLALRSRRAAAAGPMAGLARRYPLEGAVAFNMTAMTRRTARVTIKAADVGPGHDHILNRGVRCAHIGRPR